MSESAAAPPGGGGDDDDDDGYKKGQQAASAIDFQTDGQLRTGECMVWPPSKLKPQYIHTSSSVRTSNVTPE